MFQYSKLIYICWEKENLIGRLEHWKTKIFHLGHFFFLDLEEAEMEQENSLFLDKIFIFSLRAKLLVLLSRVKDW